MAYVGKTPAATALTSNDLANGIVSADKLATNAVTTVKVNADAITNAKTEFTPGLVIKGDGLQQMEKLSLELLTKFSWSFYSRSCTFSRSILYFSSSYYQLELMD